MYQEMRRRDRAMTYELRHKSAKQFIMHQKQTFFV